MFLLETREKSKIKWAFNVQHLWQTDNCCDEYILNDDDHSNQNYVK